jgi:hypothetical protein
MQLGGGVGLAIPTSGFGGSTLEYYNGSRYGLGNGLNIHGKAKGGVSGVNLAAEIDYSSVHNTGNAEPGQGTVDISQTVLSLKAGPEFRFGLPVLNVTSYLGANLAVNRFNGETTFQGASKVPSASYSFKGATRFGIGVSAGTEVGIGSLLWVDFNLSYNVMNVLGEAWEDGNPDANQRIDSYLALNDKPDPLYAAGDDKHFVSQARSIQTIQFTASILFGL